LHIIQFHSAFKQEKLYPRAVPGVWRAESRGSLRGDVHNLFCFNRRLPRVRLAQNGHKGE